MVIKVQSPAYPGTNVYITDNIGDTTGGALFCFLLIYIATPMQAVCVSALLLLASTAALWQAYICDHARRRRINYMAVSLAITAAITIIATGIIVEKSTLVSPQTELTHYKESRYGRITVEKDEDQHTLRLDGIPIASTSNLIGAEEATHYTLSQVNNPSHILLISSLPGILREIEKYKPLSIDYVEIDTNLTKAMFDYGLLERHPNVNVIHADARAWLMESTRTYDAIIACLPEPETFQINRFYTDSFFRLIASHLAKDGIFSFSMAVVDNYIAETEQKKLSSVYNTASSSFSHITLIPGNSTYFLCSSRPVSTDIPGLIAQKQIATNYIQRFYNGEVTPGRIDNLNSAIDRTIPENTDTRPVLMKFMLTEWFITFDSSPAFFYLGVTVILLIYLLLINRGEFVLFSTGFTNMSAEILTIFAFQIFFGYIYSQIGLIVTAFLGGLLPGAWLGGRSRANPRQAILLLDTALIILISLFITGIYFGGSHLPATAYLVFGFLISIVCGFQFPMILNWRGETSKKAVMAFFADLIGAAFGAIVISTVLIPHTGLAGTALAMIALKIISIILITTGTGYGKTQQA